MKTLFKSMNIIRCVSGASLNLFRYAAMVLVLLLGVGNAWASSSKTYYSTMNVAVTSGQTGYGTVYVTSSGKTSDTKNSSSTSSSVSHSYNIYATANAGYKFTSWSGSGITFGSTTTANTTGSISTSSTSSPGTSKTATASFEVIKVTAAPADVTINATDPSATYPDAAGVVVGFTTSSSNANSDFTTGGSGDSRWTISAWPTHASATSTTFNYKFVGNGSYGTNNRTFTKTVTLKGLNDGTTKTCTLTAKYPNPRVVECNEGATDLTIYPTFSAADASQAAVEKTAVFDVVYADNANNFTAAFSGETGGGTWTVTGISVDQANQKATVTYTFNGNKEVGTHTAVLTLTANNCSGWDDTSAAGGASATVTLTAENTQEATNDASVTTTANVTTEYATFAAALAAANASSGCTLKLLRNVDLGTITATNNITKAMTIDLNGKELRAAVNASSVGILTITQAVAVTIKDSKTGGKIINEVDRNSEVRTIFVNCAGATLTLESGTLAVNNLRQYASVANTSLGVTAASTSCSARVIHQVAGSTVNINGGKLDAKGTRSVYGIVQGSTAATNNAGTTVLNVTGGEIAVEAPYNALGIYAYGKVNMSAGVINTHITTNLIDAGYAADHGNNTNNGYGYGIQMKVSVSATASSCYYGTLNMTGGTINVISDRTKANSLYNYGIYLEAAATGVGAGKTATDGTLSQKASAKASIENANITVHSNTYYSYGIIVYGSYNSYDNEYFTVPIKNCNIDVQAYLYTYAICANAAVNSTYGGCYWGDVELTGNTVTAESVTAHTAHAVLVLATTAHIFKDANTTTAPIYYGEYATAAKAVINSGTYTAKTKTTTAYAVCSSTRAKTIYDSETTVQTNRKPGGNAEAYPIVIIHGGTFRGEATTTTSRAVSSGGYTTIDGGTFEAFSTSTTAYGLYAPSGKITASGATISANATQYAYGAYADCGVPGSNQAQPGFAYAGEIELNNCDITATTRTSTEARGVSVNATNKMHNWKQFKADSTSYNWATTTYNAYKSVFPCTIAGRDSVGIAIAAKATINGCDIKVTAGTTTAYGVYTTATSVPALADSVASPIVNIKNSKFTVKTDASTGSTTAIGVYAGGPTTIDGCDFTVQPKTTTAKGVYAYDKKTTITNTKFDVKATSEARLFYAEAAIGSTTGWDYHGEFELGEGNECVATSTGGNTAHILTLIATKRNIASGRFAGDYANASSALITGGSYKATATGTTCYAVNLSAEQVQGDVKAAPSCTIEDGKFWAKATGGTDGICTTNGVIGNILFKGGVYNVNTTLSKHIPEGLEEVPLASDRTEYGEGYRYEVDKAGMHGIDVCQIGSTKYKSLEEALQVVTSGQVIYMIANYTMATPGDYVLPSGATLLIPYKTGSGAGATTAIGNSAKTTTSATTPSLFRKLTFGNGVNLTCFGTIETSAEQKANGQYGANVGMPSGAYGQIQMDEGSHISMESGSRLNCWGYITGKGTINVKNNATVLEGFQLGDWCGGTNATTLTGSSNKGKAFPITHYFYQSIECPITYRPGAKALGSTHVNMSFVGTVGQDAVPLVGTSDAMFIMDNVNASEDTWVMKDYDETTDYCYWTINSGASIGNLIVKIPNAIDVNSADYILPICSNMAVVLNYGEGYFGQHAVFTPGSKLIINKEGTLVLSGVNVSMLDLTEYTGATIYRASYSPTWGTTNPRSTSVKDAELFVHGKVDLRSNGGLYTSASGANIHSTNADAGQVLYTTVAQGNKTTYYLKNTATSATAVTVNAAKLLNEDNTYSSTASTSAGDVWVYINGKWTKKTKEGCFSVETTDVKHYYIQPSDIVEVNYPAESNNTYTSVTGSRVFVWDEDCYWWEVETEPTAEGYYRSINADHNGKYNYYYYDSSAACWKIKTITVTWNINGSNTNYSVGYGTKPEWLGATPTKTSTSSNYVWRWDGWTQGSSTEVIDNKELPIVTENTTFTAHFYEKYYEYNIIFKNSDGTILESKNWIAGTTPSYDGTPTKNPTAAETYEFNGTWSPAITTVTGSATYTAQYTATTRQYNVEFVNYDMSSLGSILVDYNATPTTATYKAAIAPSDFEPYKPDNSAYSFVFDGWRLNGASSNGFAQVKGDQTYVAQFAETTKKYRITFVDEDGETVLHWTQLEYDAMPSYDGPATSSFDRQDVEWLYAFTGWTPDEFTQVKGPQTYTATYNKTKRQYPITWVDGNGATLTTTNVAYGTTPTYPGTPTPTKASTNTINYTFNNTWSPALAPVTGDATYTAQFNETERTYALTIGVNNAEFGSVAPASVTGIPYNAAVTVNNNTFTVNGITVTATPTAATAQYTYAFSSWSNVPNNVTADVANIQAVFTRTLNTYTVTFNDHDDTELKKQTVDWNTAATAPANPSREGYTFTGWDKAFNAVTADLVVTAQYSVNQYTITFDSKGGSAVASITKDYGAAVTAPANPTREGYTFNVWNPAVPSVMPASNTNCVAQWTINKYNLTVETNNSDWGTVSGGGTYDYNSNHEIAATPEAGYKFVQWNDGNADATRNVTIPAGNVTYTATFAARDDINYTVKHWQQNVENDEYTEFESETKQGTTATATAAVAKSYTGFEAKAFEQGTIAANGSTEVNIYYDRLTYEITWKDGDGNTIETHQNVKYGATPTYNGATPTHPQTEEWVYTFDNWTPGISAVTANVTYTATFTQEKRKYHVTWTGESVIDRTDEVAYGDTPYYGVEPTKVPDESQVYTFKWMNISNAEIGVKPVTCDVTYAGSFTGSPRPYTITFVNDNGEQLQSSPVNYGITPEYNGSTPVSSHTGDGYAYTFEGWKPELVPVGGTATYTAKFIRSADAIVVKKPETVVNNTIAPTTTVEDHGTLTIGDAENDVTLHTNVTVVENGGELVVSNGSSIVKEDPSEESIIIVESGGQLDVADNGSIAADVFIIQATTEEQGELDALEEVQVSGELSETGSKNLQAIYYDLTRKHGTENFLARVWYAVAVPWAVEVPNYGNGGVFIKRGEEFIPQRLGATFDLLSYDGDCRATNGASANCWVYLEDEIDAGTSQPVMVPGKLYMIYLTEETSTIRFKKKAGEAIHTNSLTVSAHTETSNANDANWNGVANPATYRAYMNISASEGGLVQKFVPGTQPRDGGSYLPLDLTDKQAVGQPFFVQVDPTADPSVMVTRNSPNLAPRRAQTEGDKEVRYAIGIAANGKLADRLYIQTAEEKEDKYVIGKDMSKMSVSSYVAQMWVERYGSKLCQNTMALTRDKAVYPLGIYAPQAGEYMIFAPTDMASGDNIYLTYDGRVIWNLTMAPYYATLEQGTTTNYGLRLIRSNAPAVTTGVDEVQSENAQCTKVIMDDHVYILRGEELYTITGQKAK